MSSNTCPSSPNVRRFYSFSVKWINKSEDSLFLFAMQDPSWHYPLDFTASLGIGQVLRKRKQKNVKRRRRISWQPSSYLQDYTKTSSHSIYHPRPQYTHLHTVTYLESPSHKAGFQRTSCKRNKVIYLISISAFPKESSHK